MKKRMMSILVPGMFFCLLGLAFQPSAIAADGPKYPARAVEVINQFGPGGGTDLFVRAIAIPFAQITKLSLHAHLRDRWRGRSGRHGFL